MKSNLIPWAALVGLSLLIATPDARAMDVSGDFRWHAYTEAWRDTRDGGKTNSSASGVRLRLRLREDLSEACRFQTRFAATALDEGNDWDFYLRSNRDSGTEVNPGTATLDEFFLRCNVGDGRSQWRIGRMQSNLDLPHMATRSFDRSQASAINIGWTDGIAYRREFDNGWYADVMAQYNGRNGNGQTLRGPIGFDDSGSRIGFFGILGSDEAVGPIFMRALSLTVYPDSLAPRGLSDPEREDYLLAAFKVGAGWDLDESGRRLIAVAELAHAFNRPQRFALRLPGEGRTDPWGWQVGVDIDDLFPRHSMGINYGQSDGSMLVSNDFRPNNELFEYRWQFQASRALRFEFRARWRRELERLIDSPFLQRDWDIRFRTTYRF
jgi:hypothetical protein